MNTSYKSIIRKADKLARIEVMRFIHVMAASTERQLRAERRAALAEQTAAHIQDDLREVLNIIVHRLSGYQLRSWQKLHYAEYAADYALKDCGHDSNDMDVTGLRAALEVIYTTSVVQRKQFKGKERYALPFIVKTAQDALEGIYPPPAIFG